MLWPNFCSVLQEISEYMKQMESGMLESTRVNTANSAANIIEGEGLQNAMPNGAITNLVVIASFAAFAWTVQYIISSIQWCCHSDTKKLNLTCVMVADFIFVKFCEYSVRIIQFRGH